MSTSEAQVIARALFDSLVGGALDALRTAAIRLESGSSENIEQRIAAVLPSDTPREVKNLVLALGKEGRLGQLAAVASAFEGMTQRGTTAMTGEVISAEALDAAQRAKIEKDLASKYGEALTLRFSVDPSLIGGLIIRIGDQVLDNSLRSRLSAVQRSMLAS